MRRLLFITAFALFLAVPLWAQRGGGVRGGFGRGFSAPHAGGGHFSAGMRSGTSRGPARLYSRGFSRGPYLHNGFRNGSHGHFRDRGFRRNRFNLGWGGYPWWGAYYDPWLWDWSNDDARFDADYYHNLAQANEMNQQSLEQQSMLRQEETDGDQDAYARSESPRSSQSPATQQETQIVSPTVLVFRDHHQEEIQNYAIVGQTLWNFASPHTKKIPLSELDLTATEKANDERGLTFQIPAIQPGQ